MPNFNKANLVDYPSHLLKKYSNNAKYELAEQARQARLCWLKASIR